MNKNIRKSGVLLHITSLPSDYGIGDLGKEAYSFVDSLANNKISLWQILPTGPTGFGDSPYAARSAFAGNELFISLDKLYIDGYLELEDITKKPPFSERVDYGGARDFKMPLLKKAAENFLKAKDEKYRKYEDFKAKEEWWLSDYALFQSLCNKFNDSRWYSMWPKEIRLREEKALSKAFKEERESIEIYSVLQFFFFSQWEELKKYANDKGVEIIGDIPIFVASDSSDAWSHSELLRIDQNGQQEAGSGVPPDAFSSTGQLWGNPVYRWEEHEKTGFAWWIKRIESCFRLCNIIRIDHFRGFEAFWQVPAGDKTAENGKWVKGPGQKFFDAIKSVFGNNLPIIAEDLGVITPEVEKLRDDNNLPGMKILHFAFGFNSDGTIDSTNLYLPHNCNLQSVAYTGTHDNNTTIGWYKTLDDGMKDYVRRYFECSDQDILWRMIRSLMMCNSKWVIFPMQDILGLDENARMNVPSTCGSSNWSWKMRKEDIDSPSFAGIKYYNELYGRANLSKEDKQE